MVSTFDFLTLDHLFIVTPVEKTFVIDEKVSVLALKDTHKILEL